MVEQGEPRAGGPSAAVASHLAVEIKLGVSYAVTAFAWTGFAYDASVGSGSSGNTSNVAIATAVDGSASASAGNG